MPFRRFVMRWRSYIFFLHVKLDIKCKSYGSAVSLCQPVDPTCHLRIQSESPTMPLVRSVTSSTDIPAHKKKKSAVTSETVLSDMCSQRRYRLEFSLNTLWKGKVQSFFMRTMKTFFMLNSAEHEIFSAKKYENANKVGIFIFISRELFMLSYV